MDKAILGARIREQRKKKKLTLERFSEKADIGRVFLGEIERGVKMPSLKVFIKILNILDISADVLLRDEVNAAKPYVLNELTQKMQGLSASELKAISDVLDAMLKNFKHLRDSE